MNRLDVYKLIDSERDYQDRLPSSRTDGREHNVGESLVMLSYYNTQAIEAWTKNAGDKAALDIIRKIAAICVRCMEHYDTPSRTNR